MHFLRMDGKEIQERRAGDAHCAKEQLRRCEVDHQQIKCVIPHQANLRIIEAVRERLGATPAQVFINLDKYGNHSAVRWRIGAG